MGLGMACRSFRRIWPMLELRDPPRLFPSRLPTVRLWSPWLLPSGVRTLRLCTCEFWWRFRSRHVPGSLQRLKEGLAARGYEEGKNIILDWRNLPDDEAAQKTAEEFVRNKVDLIVAFENQTIRAAKAVVSQIPVVFLHATDPVADGYVESLARPGGNMTGFVGLRELPDKQVELFKEIV